MIEIIYIPENILDIITRISAGIIGILLIYYSLSRFMRLLKEPVKKKDR